MANSKIPNITLADTLNTQRLRINQLLDSVGDVSALTTAAGPVTNAINELDAELGTITSGAMGTTASTVSGAINELDGRLDSINNTELLSPRMDLTDAAATNTVAGKLEVGDSADFADNVSVDGNLTVGGNTTMVGTLTVDGQVTFKAGSDNNISLGDAATDTITLTGEVNSNVIPDANNTYDLGSASKEWRHVYVDGTVNADNVAADSATIGTLKVTDLTDNRVVIVGTGGELEGDTNFTFDGNVFSVGNTSIDKDAVGINTTGLEADSATMGTAKVSDLTEDRVVIVGPNGELEDHTGLTYDGTTLNVAGDLDVDTSASIASAKIEDLTDNRVVIAGTGGELEDDANLTFDGSTFTVGLTNIVQATGNTNVGGDLGVSGNVQIDGNLTVDGIATLKAGTDNNINLGDIDATTDTVTFNAEVASHITPDDDNTYDLGSSTKEWRHGYFDGTVNADNLAADSATLGTVKVTDLTAGRIVTVGTNGEVQDDADLTYSPTTDTLSVSNIDIGTQADLASAKVEDLTNNRIVIAGTGGELEDDANLTFDGTTLAATAAVDITGDLDVDNININGNTVTSTNTNGAINITPDGTGEVVISTATVSDLTDNRIIVAGTSGALEDDANLTFDGTTFEVGTNFDVDVATGNTNIDGNLDVDGTTDLDATNVDGDLDVTGSFTTITTDGLTEGDNNLYYTTARADSDARSAVSATDAGGDGSFAYDSATGVFTYTGPSATDVRAHITAGEGIDIVDGEIRGENATTSNKGIASFSSDNFAVSSGEVSIKDNGITLGTETTGNYVATIAGTVNEIEVTGSGSETASVTVGLPNDVTVGNNLTVINDFTVGGSFTVAGEQRTAAQYIFLLDSTTGTPTLNSGITVDRGNEDSAVFQWNETGDYWEAGTKDSLNRLALQDDSANFTSLSVNNDLVVSGNLDIRGTTTTIDTTNLTIEDNLIILNGNQTGTPSTALRSGLEIERGDASNAKFQFNENTDQWEFTGPKTGTLAVTGDIGNATITLTAGTDLSTGGNFTTNQSGNETITINHADITRTNTTTTASPAYGASFTAIDTLTTNARGHVTGARTKTVTLPAAYSHPTHPGDSASIDTGALTGATVISDLDLNITTDTLGHVTDANAAVATRTLTLADLGYTGATNANNYSLPLATNTVRGGIELFNNTDQSVAANSVTTTAGRTYGIQLNSANQGVINVPWTDTVYSHPTHDGDDIAIDTGPLTGATVISDLDFNVTTNGLGHVTDANGTIATRDLTLADLGYTGATNANNYSLPLATDTVRGGIELFSNTDQSVAANTVTATAGRTYGIQLNAANQAVVNVPWVDTNTDTNTTYSAGKDLDLNGTTFDIESTLNHVTAITTASNTDFTLTTSGTGDIYLDPNGDTIFMRGGSSVGQQLEFQLNTTEQAITASDALTFKTDNANGFLFQAVTSANADRNVSVSIRNTDTAPSDDQTLGYLKFQGENTVSDFKDYAYIVGKTVEVDNGIEDGSITLYTLDSGTAEPVFSAGGGIDTTIQSSTSDFYFRSTKSGNPPFFGDPANAFVPSLIIENTDTNHDDSDVVGQIKFVGDAPVSGRSTYGVIGSGVVDDVSGNGFIKLGVSRSSTGVDLVSGGGFIPFEAEGRNEYGNVSTTIRATGHISLEPYSDKVLMRGNFGDPSHQLEFSVASDAAQSIKANGQLVLYSNNVEVFRGDGTGAFGDTTISSRHDLYLRATGDTVYMQGISANEQLSFQLGTTEQTIASSDSLRLNSGNYTSIEADNSVLLEPGDGKVILQSTAQEGYLDFATTATIKLYTGSLSGTLNSTWSGDDLTVQGDINSVSDVRTKENIETVENGLDLVSQLRGVWYNKIAEEDRKVGVIAQEVEEVLPEVVHTDTEGMKSVDYGKMVGVLIEAIKELKQEIDELKGK